MNKIINCDDIQTILNEFIFDIKTLLAWRHTCRKNMRIKFFATLDNITGKHILNDKINIYKRCNLPYIHDIFNIIQINTLPHYFDDSYLINFKYLIHLNCTFTDKITDKSVKHLLNLSLLYCNNILTDDSVSKLTNLHILDLNNNILITDESLCNLTKLKHLILNDTCDQISDKSLIKLTNLQVLDLRYNMSCYITNDSISKLINLTHLNISSNQYIDRINISSLKVLLINRKLTDSSINCSKLTHLYCVENEIITDDLIDKLPNLIFLDCGYNNNLTNNALYKLPNLTYLDCGFNMKFDDNGISSLRSLKNLYCSYNLNITNKSLPFLINLTFLSCGSNNKFTARGILNLINLEELICHYGRSNINIIDLKPLRKLKKINGNYFL